MAAAAVVDVVVVADVVVVVGVKAEIVKILVV